MPEETYAGDISAKQAWEKLSEDPDAVLIDVRTEAEYTWVGNPNLSDLGKDPLRIPWQMCPGMGFNLEFVNQVSSSGVDKDAPLLFICRSGVRSAHAAEAMTAAGFRECYNVAGGFEGDRDTDGHRGNVGGWKADGLPWQQN